LTKDKTWSRIRENLTTITFDDFYTLRYSDAAEREDIIYPILRMLREQGLDVADEEFLKNYREEDEIYRRNLKETMRESLLDNIVLKALTASGFEARTIGAIIRKAVDYGLATRKAEWFPDAKESLLTLRKKGYKLGLISNTHWRISGESRKEFMKFFDAITLSYEHGYAKPHPSIFFAALEKLKSSPDNSLHVGDDPIADIEGARNVGMKTALVRRGPTKVKADIVIERLNELDVL